ncbi:DUF3570 domain-containing protein [Oceanicoccus sp. KOV_DT_Chl]|uniref:DUF3570 domain-containing protein n=1 Tax=Oceanicoccus sp. KOV_DT_Chl TaxID=1904639 RepID=UPI001F43CA61|nr:DUF3570 domain-containing protein [Oceanicoccus sp. KOV_DT_Chl]
MVVTNCWKKCTAALLTLSLTGAAIAAVLPEERGDVMYHRYEGGGITIDGPSVLVRKNFKDTYSLSANYYVDKVSSASIDVVTSGASAYSEERTEYSFSGDYLYDRSLLSAGFTSSEENDYQAETFFVGVSQDMFGDLTTVSFGYARGNDTVEQTGNDDFQEEVDRQNYRLGISQILTPNLLMAVNYESITDEGFLNNPYRNYRYLVDPNDPALGYQQEQEVYPNTRTSDALALRFSYYLPYRAALKAEYRFFTDDWGIDADTFQLSYTHPFGQHWIVDVKYRFYQQGQADFYSDLFQTQSLDRKDYRARDKELSEFDSNMYSVGVSYQLPEFSSAIEKSKISLQWDYIQYEYNNFSDLQDINSVVGEEELYSFDADVIKLYFSIWY